MKLSDVIQKGTAGAQPAATTVPQGTLYYQTDTGILQRSSGSAWETYAAGGVATGQVGAIGFIIDGGGSVITTGIKGDLYIPFGCTINSATLLADQSGSIVVNIWKVAFASYPATVANKITSVTPPTITANTNSQDATLSGWTTAISAGDTLRFNVDSATTITRVTLILKVTRT